MNRIRTLPRKVRNMQVPVELASPERQAEIRRNDYVSYVTSHPDYARIAADLRKGKSVKTIVRWLERDNRLDGTPAAVMTSAIYAYRASHRDVIQNAPHDVDSIEGLIKFTEAAPYDTYTELAKLYDVQKMRIAIDVQTEVQLGKMFENTHKEIRVAVELLEKMEANNPNSAGSSSSDVELSKRSADLAPEVRDNLKSLKLEESSKDRLSTLMSQFTRHIHENKNPKKA